MKKKVKILTRKKMQSNAWNDYFVSWLTRREDKNKNIGITKLYGIATENPEGLNFISLRVNLRGDSEHL